MPERRRQHRFARRLTRDCPLSGGAAAPKEKIHFLHEPLEIDRFCIELVAAGGKRLLARTRQRVCGQGNQRDVTGRRIALSRRVNSQPSTIGKSRSIRIRSGSSTLALTYPASPSSAVRNSNPPSN